MMPPVLPPIDDPLWRAEAEETFRRNGMSEAAIAAWFEGLEAQQAVKPRETVARALTEAPVKPVPVKPAPVKPARKASRKASREASARKAAPPKEQKPAPVLVAVEAPESGRPRVHRAVEGQAPLCPGKIPMVRHGLDRAGTHVVFRCPAKQKARGEASFTFFASACPLGVACEPETKMGPCVRVKVEPTSGG